MAMQFTPTPDDLASPEYRALIQQVHQTQKWGSAGKSHADSVVELVKRLGARSILDYGCGRGTLKPIFDQAALGIVGIPWAVEFREYDPGVIGKDNLPQPADAVVCTDVLEHIEPDRLDNVLRHIRSLCRLGAFFVIACRAAKLVLPDGRNAHLLQQPPDWWRVKLLEYGFIILKDSTHKNLWVWCKI